nr:hypothetical protein [Tanacetum cinerariifolium]
MTKVIKGEFEKLEDLKIEDVSLTCDTSLEIFNEEFNRISRMDDDLFIYEVETANIPCDQNKDDDSENKCHMKLIMMWDMIQMIGDDEVEFTDEESSNNEDEVDEVFRIDKNIFDFETPICKAFKEFNYLLQIDPYLLTKNIKGYKTYDEYKDDWIYEWNKYRGLMKIHRRKKERKENPLQLCIIVSPSIIKLDVRNGQHVVGRIMDIVIEETYLKLTLLETHSIIMIMNDEEYVAIKEDEYDDLARTSKDACRAYQEVFRMMDEGWMVTRAE